MPSFLFHNGLVYGEQLIALLPVKYLIEARSNAAYSLMHYNESLLFAAINHPRLGPRLPRRVRYEPLTFAYRH